MTTLENILHRTYTVKIYPHAPPGKEVVALGSPVDLLDFSIRQNMDTFSTPYRLAQAIIDEVNEIFGENLLLTKPQPTCTNC